MTSAAFIHDRSACGIATLVCGALLAACSSSDGGSPIAVDGGNTGGAVGSGAAPSLTGGATSGTGGSVQTGGGPPSTAGAGGSFPGDAGRDGGDRDFPCEPVAPATPVAAQDPKPDPNRAAERHYFRIRVRDTNGGAIRGAKLTSTTALVLYSDDNGNVALDEPLTDADMYFHVSHPGFEIAADAFGNRGKAVKVTDGGSADIALTRTNGDPGPAQGDLATRLLRNPAPGRAQCLAIRFVDEQDGRGVPLVRADAFGETYWSDSQGMVAYCHPDHMNGDVTFAVKSHGYSLASGSPSVTLRAEAGQSANVKVERGLAAQRLYRIVGAGIYRDSVILGLTTPLEKPTLNALVAGSDTADSVVFKGKLFWMWQDTHKLSYALGNFHGTAATSELPSKGGLAGSIGANLTYFTGKDGFAKGICDECAAAGGSAVWAAGLVNVPDANGQEQLYSAYSSVDGSGTPREGGIMHWDEAASVFRPVVRDYVQRMADGKFIRPDEYGSKFRDGAGKDTLYYPKRVRVAATAAAIVDPAQVEQYTAYGEGNASDQLQKLPNGTLDYAYRKNSKPTRGGVDAAQDLDGKGVSPATGTGFEPIQTYSTFNRYRRRFVRQSQKRLQFGEVWHSEADTPMGPWVYAEKVVVHDNYTFYNISPHPELGEGGERFAFFEGTYTTFLTDAVPTPRYDYNQVMYRLDLDDPRVVLPVPVYDLGGDAPGDFVTKEALRPGPGRLAAPFMALDRPKDGLIPLRWSAARCDPTRRLVARTSPAPGDAFYALPPGSNAPRTIPLYEYQNANGQFAYTTNASWSATGFTRAPDPIARVYDNPIRVEFQVRDYLGNVIADAGDDQCVAARGGGSARVSLDAANTIAATDTVSEYTWTLRDGASCEQHTGREVQLDLTPGTHAVELVIETAAGVTSRDVVLVTVRGGQ